MLFVVGGGASVVSVDLLASGETPKGHTVKHEFISAPSEADRRLRDLLVALKDGDDVLALDTETDGLSRWRVVRLFQVFHPDVGVLLIDAERCRATIDKFMHAFAREASNFVCAHNASFDLLPFGRPPDTTNLMATLYDQGRVRDTMIAAKVEEPHLPGGLKAVFERHCPELKHQLVDLDAHMRRGKVDWASVPITDDTYQAYAAQDVRMQWTLHDMFSRMGWWNERVSRETKTDGLYQTMVARGLRVDVGRAAELLRQISSDYMQHLMHAMQRGVKNPLSNKQVAAALARENIHLTERTPTGQVKVDRASLEGLRHKSDVARQVLGCRETHKLKTLIEPIHEAARDGERIYPSIRTLGAKTSRSSVADPPLQQLPKNDARIRALIRAEPTEELVAIDYSQMELRMLAEMAAEETMLAAFREGADLHEQTTSMMSQQSSLMSRQAAKTLNFAIIYGAGPSLIAKRNDVSEEEARSQMRAWFDCYPRVAQWRTEVVRRAKERGFVELLDERRIPLEEDETYKAVNYLIQGNTALLMKAVVRKLDAADLWQYAKMVIHDEVLFSFPVALVQHLTARAEEEMRFQRTTVTYEVESTLYGSHWAQA